MTYETPLAPANEVMPVNSYTAGDQTNAVLEPLAGGGYVTVWQTSTQVRGQLFDPAGNKVGGETILATGLGTYSPPFDLVALSVGGFEIAWDDDQAIRVQRYDNSGAAVGEQLIASPNASANSPQLTELTSGSTLVSWFDAYGSAGPFGQIYAADGTPMGGRINLTSGTDETTNYRTFSNFQTTALPNGGFVAAWTAGPIYVFGNPTNALDIKAQIFDSSGARVGSEFIANTSTTYKQALYKLESFDNGNFIVVYLDYSQNPGDRSDVRAQMYTPDGQRFGNEIEVPVPGAAPGTSESDGQVSGYAFQVPGGMAISWADSFRSDGPYRMMFLNDSGAVVVNDIAVAGYPTDVAVLPNGEIAFTLVGNSNVYVQLFSSDFQMLGQALQIDPGPVENIEQAPQLATGADGNLLTLWQASDGNGQGYFSQLFTPLAQGTPNDDHLVGTSGDNVLDGKAGADLMEGGAGNDTYYVDNPGDRVVEHVGEGIDTVITTVSYTLPSDAEIEYLRADAASTDPLVLTGNDFNQAIYGNGGNNVLVGGGGADLLVGGGGNDTYYVDSNGLSSDTVVEAAGDGFDRVAALTTFSLQSGAEVELLEAVNLTSTDRLDLSGNDFAQTIGGNNGTNVIYAFGGNDTVYGYGGDDYLVGGDGEDSLYGGTGNDTYYLLTASDAAQDHIFENSGEGSDRIATLASYTLAPGLSVEILESLNSTSRNAMDLTGNELDNVIGGNNDINVLHGGAGNDTLAGYEGNDHLFGDSGDDVLLAGPGADLMVGGTGNDKFYVDDPGDTVQEAAGAGYDTVASSITYTVAGGSAIERMEPVTFNANGALDFTGNEGANYLIGNNGTNTLDGGLGADTLEGLGGQDYFKFSTALGNGNVDRINDYLSSYDRFMLDHNVFTGLTLGALAPGAFNTGTAATEADDRIIYNSDTGAVYFDADGLGGLDAAQFAWIGTHITLSSVDFLVV